ncbi:Ig-like domain-containing protein [Pontibacter roseus]|uniref:Ig-like domain-containing protein n=1 Tax=Pontibacter roseus TaxID=336989 RepID=UPI000360D7DE|nr:Ig-like domain-containing protein [Pontibacter roseus]
MKFYYKLAVNLLLTIIFFAVSCDTKKEEPTPQVIPNHALTVHDNVLVVDSSRYSLILDSALLSAGTYRFISSGTALNAPVGTVIVGAQGRGFLRRVTAINTQNNETTLQTEQASLDELFKSGMLNLSTASDSLVEGRKTSSEGFSYSFEDVTVYNEGALSLLLKKGSVSMNPDWVFKLNFNPNYIYDAEIATYNAPLEGNFEFNVTADQAVTLIERSSTLKKYHKDFTRWVPVLILGIPVAIPVTVRMLINLDLQYSAAINGKMNQNATFSNKSHFDIGVLRKNGQWQGIYDLSPNNTFETGAVSGSASANVKMALVPKISFQLYGVVGPYASIGLQEELNASVTSPDLNWDFRADVWLQSKAGIEGKIFSKELPDFSISWDTEKLSYKTPERLERISGDNQTGQEGKPLPLPVKVRVLDSKGNPQRNVPVYFVPANGSVTPTSVLSDANGFAEATWTLGVAASSLQHLNVSAKTANGQSINNAPLDFAATATPSDSSTISCIPDEQLNLLIGSGQKEWRLMTLTMLSDSTWTYYTLPNDRIIFTFVRGNIYSFSGFALSDNPAIIKLEPNTLIWVIPFCDKSGGVSFNWNPARIKALTHSQLIIEYSAENVYDSNKIYTYIYTFHAQ